MGVQLLLIAIFGLAGGAFAGEFDPRGNTEVIALDNADIDLELKTILSSQARKSIEFMHFAAAPDKTGMRFLQAIRSAQLARGVKVTGLYDRHMSAFIEGNDKFNFVKAMLTDPNLECRGEVFCAHPIEKFSSGLSLSDCIHGKMIIIDRGTPNEIIIWGGTGITAKSTGRIDSGFIIRPIDHRRPYLGTDMKTVFDRVLGALKRLAAKSWIKIPVRVDRWDLDIPEKAKLRFTKKEGDRRRVIEILNHLRRPAIATPENELKPFVFQPKSMRLFSNDLYVHLTNPDFDREAFASDTQKRVGEVMRGHRGSAVISAYSLTPDDPLYRDYVDYVKRGNTLVVFTNGHEAYAGIGAKKGIPAYLTYEYVLQLLKDVGDGPGVGKVVVNVLDPEKARRLGLDDYLHKKNVTLLDPEGAPTHSFDGSDNFTFSSAKYNDEILVETEDRRFAKHGYDRILAEKDAYLTLDEAEIRARYEKRPWWYRCVRSIIKKNV